MSSTNRKVCIQLPSLLSTDLIIKDYGPGLDDQEIDKYLNCLFSSSKGDSNSFMGGFGLIEYKHMWVCVLPGSNKTMWIDGNVQMLKQYTPSYSSDTYSGKQ